MTDLKARIVELEASIASLKAHAAGMRWTPAGLEHWIRKQETELDTLRQLLARLESEGTE